MRLLAYAAPRFEFAIADAINDMGGFAVAPRHVELIRAHDGKPDMTRDCPRWPGYLFLSLTDDQWHKLRSKRMSLTTWAEGAQTVWRANPPRMIKEIGPAQWAVIETLLERAETEYHVTMGNLERQIAAGKARLKMPKWQRGDLITILDGLFAGQTATVATETTATVNGLELMGKPVSVDLKGIAAE